MAAAFKTCFAFSEKEKTPPKRCLFHANNKIRTIADHLPDFGQGMHFPFLTRKASSAKAAMGASESESE